MAELVAMRLKREGYGIGVAHDGAEALDLIRAEPPDLAIVDIMLPSLSGTDLVAQLRQDPRTAAIPIIMMTAKGEETDIVAGLRLGADDYVTKPFSLSVLVARVAAVLRRAAAPGAAGDGIIKVDTMTIDPRRHAVEVGGEGVGLTVTEYRLLVALAAARGRVLTRDQLVDQAISPSAIVTDRTIDVHLASLRKKLGQARSSIETVRGVGYRLRVGETQSNETT